jgi:hypothetical protein
MDLSIRFLLVEHSGIEPLTSTLPVEMGSDYRVLSIVMKSLVKPILKPFFE